MKRNYCVEVGKDGHATVEVTDTDGHGYHAGYPFGLSLDAAIGDMRAYVEGESRKKEKAILEKALEHAEALVILIRALNELPIEPGNLGKRQEFLNKCGEISNETVNIFCSVR